MENQNKPALDYLKVLIDYYQHRINTLVDLVDVSYTAFLDYSNAKYFLNELKNLYYKLTAKEYKD